MVVLGNSSAETSAVFPQPLRAMYSRPLFVIRGNGPARRGLAIWTELATPNLSLRLAALPARSPRFNADEAIWD